MAGGSSFRGLFVPLTFSYQYSVSWFLFSSTSLFSDTKIHSMLIKYSTSPAVHDTNEWKKINLWAWENFYVPSSFISSVLCISKHFLNFWRLFFICTIFKVLIEFVTILLLFYILVFCHEACGPLAPRTVIWPTSHALGKAKS